MKTLNLNLNIDLPNGQKVGLVNHAVTLTTLEAYAVEAISAATGGRLSVSVEASISES